MTSENITKERWDQLGLPPMELAESSESSRNSYSVYRICIVSTVQKLLLMVLLTVFAVGTYVLLLKVSENYDTSRSTEIIIITSNSDMPNVTFDSTKLFLHLKNATSEHKMKRKKRNVASNIDDSFEDPVVDLNDEQMQKAREIILKHDVLCKNEEKQEICKGFVTKLKALAEGNDISKQKEDTPRIQFKVNHGDDQQEDSKRNTKEDNPPDISKREASPITNLDSIIESIPTVPLEIRDASPLNVLPHTHSVTPQHLTDTCLLAKLLKQNYPRSKGIYDPTSEFLPTHYEAPLVPQSRYFPPSVHAPFLQARDIESPQRKIHPQDVDIFMSFLASKAESTATERSSNSSRETACPSGTVPCLNGDTCINEKQWCDGKVDCSDVSDEARCTCKSRVDKVRLCDGYFDCPFGEDEMGCFGCSENMFSCEDLDINSQSTCFSKEQRCNNVVDCPNHKDEVECNMLAPSLLKKPLFAISNTEGFLHRNFKGDWYAVCKNPYMWAHDACRRETGLIIRPPFLQIVPIDPMLKIDYLNTGPGGLIQTSDTCMNSSAVYVTCPDLLCGTRVQSTSQLLRENAAIENHLFGRNKRFLLNRPFPLMYYGNRLRSKRNLGESTTNNEIKYDTMKKDVFGVRDKRAESRVVGGKPSQPAAWPWMVAVYRNGMFHCGGVVITHSWVVSAAHCVHKFWDYYYEVQVGMLRRFSFSPQEQSHKVTHVIVNQHYSQTDMKNDLSLLRVEPAIQFSRWIRPICLPSPDTAGPSWRWGPPPGTICTAVGWGATTEHGPDPDHMREVEVPIWENCKHREDRAGKEICAGLSEGGKDACQGDSGGPLLCRNPLNSQQWYMAGIVSHGDGCARKDEPGVYTRVSLFVKWIKYHISSKSLPVVQPIQECPGFKCESGISKCLPLKRKCDRIVDCLDGEDEINCKYTDLPSTVADNLFTNTKTLEELLESKSAQTSTTAGLNSDENEENGTVPTNRPVEDDNSSTYHMNKDMVASANNIIDASTEKPNLNTEEHFNHAPKLNKSSDNENPDFQHASTLEIINTKSSEDKDNNSQSNKSTDDNHSEFTNTSTLENTESSENADHNAQFKKTTDNLDLEYASTHQITNIKSIENVNHSFQPKEIEHELSQKKGELNSKSSEGTDRSVQLTTNENLDFAHASTIEMINTKSAEDTDQTLQAKQSSDKVNAGIERPSTPEDSKSSEDMDIKFKESVDSENQKDVAHPSTLVVMDEKVLESINNLQPRDTSDSENADLKHSSTNEEIRTENSSDSSSHTELSKESSEGDIVEIVHPSTHVVMNDTSSENIGQSEEHVTADPIRVPRTDSSSWSRGDGEMISMDISGESLESRSSILERITETTEILPITEKKLNEELTEKVLITKSPFDSSTFLSKRGDMDATEKATTPLMDHIQEDNLQHNKIEISTELVIQLLPEMNSSIVDQEAEESTVITTKLPSDATSNPVIEERPVTRSPDLDDKKNLITDKIEDIVFTELEPAKLRRKHRVPQEFECRRIEQTIPYHQRCNHKADCEDGTDELDCTCVDYLFTFDDKLICDGVFDCADGQDESECFACPENHFLCKRSQICLPEKHVCDGKPECPEGEDELDCFALTNGLEMEFDVDERPVVNLEGYLTKKHFNDWHVVCDDKLTEVQQEEAATEICRYLGFSSANRYNVKYINLKGDEIDEQRFNNKRNRRNTVERIPIHFAYRQENENDTARHVIIKEPQVIKEQCVPNITKTCKSLYVFCDHSLFTDFDNSDNLLLRQTETISNYMWPWIAKVFVEGDYRCTGVLVNLSWVLISDSCLWDSTMTHHYITVVLGSHKTLGSVTGMHEQVYQVDAKKDIYRSKASLLHLKEPAQYSNAVKPMVVSSSYTFDQKSTCVAVGQGDKNNTISVLLEETSENCHRSNRCFKRKVNENLCPLDVTLHRHWAGIVSCHTEEQGWFPAATFVDGRGECGLGDRINGTDIENLKNEIKHYYGKKSMPTLLDETYGDNCEGVRCSRGLCIEMALVCDGVRNCEDGLDESENACQRKHIMCEDNPYHKGCECSVGQMKCRNGKCISKELFKDGNNDCGDSTDEPGQTTCSDYLARVMPSRLCDGILHCHDRSDEDPMFCKCFAKKNYKCSSKAGVDHCVATDMVCDGIRDCPNGEDEQTCIGLNAPHGTPYGTGQVIVRSHGVWHSKCYPIKNHTKSELEAICSELGYISGHAKQITEMENFAVHPYNHLLIDAFNEITLNNNTVIKMRRSHEPMAKAVLDDQKQNCYPLFIECR